MIRKRIAMIVTTMSLVALDVGRAAAQGGYDLLQQGLVRERTDGKIAEAIQIYQRITREFASDRSLVAKALLAMGQSYERLGNTEARKTYDRLVRDYADQREQAADARTRLAALESPVVAHTGLTARLISKDVGERGNTDLGLSDDGRYLSYSGGSMGLAILDLRTGKTFSPIATTQDLGAPGGYVVSSVVSPDGRQVAYVWDMGMPSGEELRVLELSGGKPATSRGVYLNPGYMGVHGWSPDGKSVVVVRELGTGPDLTSQIAVVSIADGAVKVLRANLSAGGVGGASFSPDGRYVAYHARSGALPSTDARIANAAATDVFVVTMDGRETRVAEDPSADRSPRWSPDGTQIVFLSNRTGTMSLWAVPVAEGKSNGPAKLLKENVGRFIPLSITRQGSLFYISGNPTTNVYTAELDSTLRARAPTMATKHYVNANRAGVWSPDGQHLAYHGFSPRGVVVRIQSVNDNEDREVPLRIQVSGWVRWFPDGQSLLVPSRDERVLKGELGYYRVNVTSGDAELLHQTASQFVGATRPDLSPDGKTIFYLETPQQPVRFDIDSRRETKLQAPEGAQLSLAVSPDGARIAYLSTGSVHVAPAVGGEARLVGRWDGESDPGERRDGLGLAWAPDQQHLFLVRPNLRAIWRIAVAGGEPENIGVSLNRIRTLGMHPDGRRIVFDSVIDAPDEVWVLENFLPTSPRTGSARR